MAEVAGLVLGAVGVAGLISAFKDTLELFNPLADTRHLGREHKILETVRLGNTQSSALSVNFVYGQTGVILVPTLKLLRSLSSDECR
jgi:hypothetical protein